MNPVPVMKLVEIVRALQTSDETYQQTRDLGEKMGKTVVTTKDMPAFIVNISKPFKSTRAHIVGQKVRYVLVGGEENEIFTAVLSSLVEVRPHDNPGK